MEVPQLAFDDRETIMDQVSQQNTQSQSPVVVFAYAVLTRWLMPDTPAPRCDSLVG
jgi:hypothetical protein